MEKQDISSDTHVIIETHLLGFQQHGKFQHFILIFTHGFFRVNAGEKKEYLQ